MARSKKALAEKTSVETSAPLRTGLVLTNCTDAPRGITLKSGVVLLQPREMRVVPPAEQDEIRALFRSRTFQRFVDNDIFRLTGMDDDEESTDVPTPEAPVDLKQGIPVEGLQAPVSVSTPPRVVEHQQGGALPITGPEAAAQE